MFAHGETVQILTAGTVTDPYSGETVNDWSTSTALAVPGVAVADGGSLEPLQDARNQVTSDFDLLMPPTTAITAQQRVIVRGLTCEVVGRPFLWRSPFTGWTPGLVVKAKLVEG